jgi:hypothetical protein
VVPPEFDEGIASRKSIFEFLSREVAKERRDRQVVTRNSPFFITIFYANSIRQSCALLFISPIIIYPPLTRYKWSCLFSIHTIHAARNPSANAPNARVCAMAGTSE